MFNRSLIFITVHHHHHR